VKVQKDSMGSDALKKQSSLAKAFREKQFVLVMFLGILTTIVYSCISSYLFSFLTTDRGLDPTLATTAASIMSFVGIAGSLLGGILTAQTGRRKPIMLASLAIFAVGVFLLSFFESAILLVAAASMVSVGFYMIYPPQSSLIIETPEPFDPTILGAAFAMAAGVGQIASLAASPLFSTLSAALGMRMTFRIFSTGPIVAFAIGIFLRETGPKAKTALKKA
jgi:MFS family permease